MFSAPDSSAPAPPVPAGSSRASARLCALCFQQRHAAHSVARFLVQVCIAQLEQVKGMLDPEKVVIAYEPVWAIGTGLTVGHAFIGSPCAHALLQHNAHPVRRLLCRWATPSALGFHGTNLRRTRSSARALCPCAGDPGAGAGDARRDPRLDQGELRGGGRRRDPHPGGARDRHTPPPLLSLCRTQTGGAQGVGLGDRALLAHGAGLVVRGGLYPRYRSTQLSCRRTEGSVFIERDPPL